MLLVVLISVIVKPEFYRKTDQVLLILNIIKKTTNTPFPLTRFLKLIEPYTIKLTIWSNTIKTDEPVKKNAILELYSRNKNGQFIVRFIYQEDLENNKKRVKNNPEYYRFRQQITVHHFGILRRQ